MKYGIIILATILLVPFGLMKSNAAIVDSSTPLLRIYNTELDFIFYTPYQEDIDILLEINPDKYVLETSTYKVGNASGNECEDSTNFIPVYVLLNLDFGATYLHTTSSAQRDLLDSDLYPQYRYNNVKFCGVKVEYSTIVNTRDIDAPILRRTNRSFQNYNQGATSTVKVTMPAGAMPVYQFENIDNGVIFLTAEEAEKDALINNVSWRYLGVAFYALSI